MTLTAPARDTPGNHQFFIVLAVVGPNAFTSNAAGRILGALAEKSVVYEVPTRTGDQTAVTKDRQADPVAPWRHVLVSWTSKIDRPHGPTATAPAPGPVTWL